MPREEDEFRLTYYNSMTTWIAIDRLLEVFGLARRSGGRAEGDGGHPPARACRLPTYITLKDVKKRWGHGQEDVFPVAQFEKLWGDMTGAGRGVLPVRGRAPAARPATQGAGPTGHLAPRRLAAYVIRCASGRRQAVSLRPSE